MRHVDTTIIGGGQAGLAMSRYLTDSGVDHVILERGTVAERWRTERWDSLRLLTPNWMSRLPGWRYDGPDPDGFMSMPEVIDYLSRYARSFAAPVETRTAVESVRATAGGYRVATVRGELASDNVVVATGAAGRPSIPAFAARAHPDLLQLTPAAYRRAGDLPPGGVLVVGASASGVQLAAELRAAGREVLLAVGRHTRLPRTYRGRDIYWWLDRLGSLTRPAEGRPSADRGGHPPSAQLIGTPEGRDVDLGTLRRAGVALTGRLTGIDGTRARFAGDLRGQVAEADARLTRLLARIDEHIRVTGADAAPRPPLPVPPVDPGVPVTALDLAAAGITTVLWATGYRRSYPWLHVGVLGPDGEIVHRRGVTPRAGLYVLGLPLQSRLSSTFIDGVGHDAGYVAAHLLRHRQGARNRVA